MILSLSVCLYFFHRVNRSTLKLRMIVNLGQDLPTDGDQWKSYNFKLNAKPIKVGLNIVQSPKVCRVVHLIANYCHILYLKSLFKSECPFLLVLTSHTSLKYIIIS